MSCDSCELVQFRDHMFADARDKIEILKGGNRSAFDQLAPQLDYLIAVNRGEVSGDKLCAISIGIIAARWLDPTPAEFEFLFDIAEEARLMAKEYAGLSNA